MLPVALAAALVVLPPPPDHDIRFAQYWKHLSVTGPHLLAGQLRDEATELRNAKKPSDALPLFNAAVLLSPNGWSSHIGRAKTFAALGRYDEQADEYVWLLNRYRNNYAVWVWQEIAEGWIDRGQWGEATWCFSHAVGQIPPGERRSRILLDEAECWLRKALTLADLKSLPPEQLMAAHYALCDALEPAAEVSENTRKRALELRAWVRHGRGWFAEAAADCDELLKLSPIDSGFHINRAEVAYELKDYAKALHHYEAAEKHGRDLIEMAHAKFGMLIHMEEYERAKVVVEDWERLAPKDKDAAFFHAVTLRLVGKDDEADQVSKVAAVLGVRTMADQMRYELYVLGGECGELDAADRLLTRRIKNTTDTDELAEMYCKRGELRRYQGRVGEALDDLGMCIQLRPERYSPERFGHKWLLGSDDTTTELKAYLPKQ